MAARRNRKSGKFSRTARRTNRKKSFNIGKAAETALVASAATQGLFGTNLAQFITGKNIGPWSNTSDNRNHSWNLTGPELINALMGGDGGMAADYSVMSAMKRNIRLNGLSSLAQMVAIPFAFKIGRKVLAKPLINPINRAARSVGIKEVKL